MNDSTCLISECGKPRETRGWCGAHYSRWKKHGDPLGGSPSRGKPGDTCKIAECGRAISGRGYCRSHHRKLLMYGDPLYVCVKQVRLCRIDGCENKHRTGGYCVNHHEYNKRHGTPLPPPRNCTLCGATFAVVQTKQKLCGSCRHASLNARHGIRPAELADRDGADCGLCGDPVDMSLAFPDPLSPSVDHIKPWSLGGTHDLSNLQLAHLSCNCRKGNRVRMDATN